MQGHQSPSRGLERPASISPKRSLDRQGWGGLDKQHSLSRFSRANSLGFDGSGEGLAALALQAVAGGAGEEEEQWGGLGSTGSGGLAAAGEVPGGAPAPDLLREQVAGGGGGG
jgi:hypothetical protein